MLQVPKGADKPAKTMVQNDITMDQSGYFYAYLVNESSMNVYFDDFQVTYSASNVLEENHYYPFGMLNTQLSTLPSEKPLNYYKYNGKELQKELNLEWHDYGARFYDAQVGRWHSVDPLAEDYNSQSIYISFDGNPINKIDPKGTNADWVINKKTREYEWMDNVTKASNTPSGYRYIGPDSKDILRDLNLQETFITKTETRMSFGLDGKDKAMIPTLSQTIVSGNIKLTADIGYNKGKINDNNYLGKVFKGISLDAYFSQSNISTNPDLTMRYKGNFTVQYGNKILNSYLLNPKGTYAYQTGSLSLQANIRISSLELTKQDVFRNAYIKAGVTNSSLFISPKPVTLLWNLIKNPVLNTK